MEFLSNFIESNVNKLISCQTNEECKLLFENIVENANSKMLYKIFLARTPVRISVI